MIRNKAVQDLVSLEQDRQSVKTHFAIDRLEQVHRAVESVDSFLSPSMPSSMFTQSLVHYNSFAKKDNILLNDFDKHKVHLYGYGNSNESESEATELKFFGDIIGGNDSDSDDDESPFTGFLGNSIIYKVRHQPHQQQQEEEQQGHQIRPIEPTAVALLRKSSTRYSKDAITRYHKKKRGRFRASAMRSSSGTGFDGLVTLEEKVSSMARLRALSNSLPPPRRSGCRQVHLYHPNAKWNPTCDCFFGRSGLSDETLIENIFAFLTPFEITVTACVCSRWKFASTRALARAPRCLPQLKDNRPIPSKEKAESPEPSTSSDVVQMDHCNLLSASLSPSPSPSLPPLEALPPPTFSGKKVATTTMRARSASFREHEREEDEQKREQLPRQRKQSRTRSTSAGIESVVLHLIYQQQREHEQKLRVISAPINTQPRCVDPLLDLSFAFHRPSVPVYKFPSFPREIVPLQPLQLPPQAAPMVDELTELF
jgi:hypothetical protein